MQALRRSIFITFFSSNASAALQFGVSLVLARLLTPAEVGIFSITVMITNIAAIFRDFGVSSYIQREKDLTEAKLRSALGFLLVSAWSIAIAIYLVSDTVARFYAQPGIGEVMRVLSLSFVLVPFASYFYAVLARNLEAGKQAIVNAVGTLTYAASCLTLAWMGLSYMALAWASVINIGATVVVYLVLRPPHATLRPGLHHWKEIAHFGSGAILAGVIEKANAAIPDLVLGKISGPHDVGLYSRAGGLINIFYQIAGPTMNYNMVPFLARNHHEGHPLGPLLERGTAYLTAVSWPVFICIAFFSTEIIRVLYGPTWVGAAPIATVMAVASMVMIGGAMAGAGLMAIGRPYLSGLSSLTSAVMRLGLVLAVGDADLLRIAIAISVADVLTLIVPFGLMSRHLGFSPRRVLRAYGVSLRACLPCVGVALLLKLGLPGDWPEALKLLILSALIIATWLVSVMALAHPIRDELPAIFKRVLPAPLARHLSRYITP